MLSFIGNGTDLQLTYSDPSGGFRGKRRREVIFLCLLLQTDSGLLRWSSIQAVTRADLAYLQRSDIGLAWATQLKVK